jgi:N-acyl-D-aspartate/D-glutamate deacylase
MIASDGQLIVPGECQPHPRSYGTYPRVLGRYLREAHVLTLQLAIHKMTGACQPIGSVSGIAEESPKEATPT